MAQLLGEDGRGYEMARRLDASGAWREWLGEAAYAGFASSLSSPSAWESFLSPSASSAYPIQLKLRARALLFDKASIALALPNNSSLSDLNPTHFHLHGDDVFFPLEDDQQDSSRGQKQPKPASKANEHAYDRASTVASRYNEPENVNISQRHRHDELPETWYSQCLEKYRTTYQKFPYSDKDPLKRTSEGMSAYMKVCELHKRKRQALKEEHHVSISETMLSNGSQLPKSVPGISNSNEEITFLPEFMFPTNCVPETALPLTTIKEKNQKIEFYGVLDNLPTVISKSTAMMERFGIRPDYVKVGTKYRGKESGSDRNALSEDQTSLMTRKVVARLLVNAGFEGGTEVSMEVFSDLFSSHICKLGRKLKLLSDSYKKQFSSIELLKMFLQTAGYSNLGALIEITKDGNKGIVHQTPQHVRMIQTQHQNPLLQAQQLQRQMHPQMNINMLQDQNLAFQQQQQQLRRRQGPTTPRGVPVMLMDKDQQLMVDVKLENMMESSQVDGNTFGTLNKQHQLQLRQHQIQQQQQQMVMANHHAAQLGGQQAQISQLQAQNAYTMRTAPVKVEAFHELMGVDSTLKHDPEHNKLTPPSK